MKPVELSMKGFGTFLDETTLQLDGLGMVLIEGRNHDSTSAKSNGSGKTTVIKAITWCLFGEYVDGDKGIEVVHKRAKRAEVRTVWIDEDTDTGYCITRSQSNNGQSLHLEVTAGDRLESIDGKDKRETQSKVEKIFGLDYDTWCSTILYAAGNLTRFASRETKDADRKSMMKQVYGLGVVDTARGLVAGEARDAKKRLVEAEQVVERRKTQIDAIKLDNISFLLSTFEDERQHEISACVVNVEMLRQHLLAQEDESKILVELGDRLASLKVQATEATTRYTESSAAVTQLMNSLSESKVEEERTAVAVAEAELKVVKYQLEQLVGDACPFCSSPLTEGVAKAHLDSMKRSEVQLIDKVDRLKKMIEPKDLVMRARRLEVKQRLDDARKAEVDMNALRREEKKVEAAVAERSAKLTSRYATALAVENSKLEQLTTKVNPYRTVYDQAKAKLDEMMRLLVPEQEAFAAADTEVRYYEFWAEAFSDRGLISFVIDQMLPTLNRKVNEKLQVLSDGDIVVFFEGETALKSGDLRDKVSMRSLVEGIENATPSTAQDRKISLAGALAMMDIVATRQGKRIDLQLLDEPFDGLDDVGKQRLVGLLQKQQENRSTILVTTHDPTAAGAFTRRILVERKGGVARIVEER